MKNQGYTIKQQGFINSLERLNSTLLSVEFAWEELNDDDREIPNENYPFTMSFDEWRYEYMEWVDKIKSNFLMKNQEISYEPTITVGQLKELLDNFDENTQIVISKDTGWMNIKTIEYPSEENMMYTLTLHTEDDFKTTQI